MRDTAMDDANDVFDDDEEETAAMPAIYNLELLDRITHLVQTNRGTTFWVYHSSSCEPPRSMKYGGDHFAHNLVVRPSPHVRDGHLFVFDSPHIFDGDEVIEAATETEI